MAHRQGTSISLIDAYKLMLDVETDPAMLSATIDVILKNDPDAGVLVSLATHQRLSPSAFTFYANRIAAPAAVDTPITTANMAWGVLSNPKTPDEIAQAVIHAVSIHVTTATDPDDVERFTTVLYQRAANDPTWCNYLTEEDWSRILIHAATR